MKICLRATILLGLLVAPVGLPARAEVVDQVAAVVDREIITLSALHWLIEYRGFQVPEDPEQRKSFHLEILHQLIDQKLIAQEAEQSPLIRIDPEDVEVFVENYRRRFPDEESFQQRLRQMEMTFSDLRQLVRRQLAVNAFIELRFEPFIIVLPDDIQAYYNEELVPELERRSQSVPPLELVEENIRQILTVERTNQELDQWSRNARRRSRVQILLYRTPPAAPNLPQEFLQELQLQTLSPPQ